MGTGGGVLPSGSDAASVAPAGAVPPRVTTPSAPASVEPRAVNTLLADDFENGSLSQWTILVPNPLFTNASQWGPDWWLSDADQMYHWAYSSQKYAWYAGMWMWSSQNLYGGHYANNDNTWMIAGPFNLSSYSHAVLNFDQYVQTAGTGDYVGAWFSTDGNMFGGPYWYGQEGSWGDPPYFSRGRST